MPRGKSGARVPTQRVVHTRSVVYVPAKKRSMPERTQRGGKVTVSFTPECIAGVLASIQQNLPLVVDTDRFEFRCYLEECRDVLDVASEVEVLVGDKARYFCSDEHADQWTVERNSWV